LAGFTEDDQVIIIQNQLNQKIKTITRTGAKMKIKTFKANVAGFE